MLRSKKDVDKHVQDLLKKVNNETEKKLLGFNFGKLYYQIGEYKLAKQYLALFLAVKECSAPGHRLAGQIAEALEDKEAATRSYRRSYDLDNKQQDLVFKICSLLCELPSTLANRDLQQCWLERAEALQPKHGVVFELKQRLILSGGNQSKGGMEEQLKSDALSKPTDMKLRIHLLQLYMDSNRVKEAYEHMLKIESLQVFRQELEWYQSSLKVIETYKNSSDSVDSKLYCHLLNVLERLSFLKILQVGKGQITTNAIDEVTSSVHSLDVTLAEAKDAGVGQEILLHFTCQLYFQVGLLLLLRSKAGLEEENQVLSYASTLFAISYNQNIISVNNSSIDKKSLDGWIASATYSRSQCGHCIVAWETKEGRKWIIDTIKKLNNFDGKRKIFEAAFSNAYPSSPSFGERFIFPKEQVELPAFSDLLELDKSAIQLNSQELHLVIWLGIQYFMMHRRAKETDFAPDFSEAMNSCRFMRDIPFSVASWNSSAPETLSALDFEAFVYATIYSAVSLEEPKTSKIITTVPAPLTKSLCNNQQTGWWQAAIKLITGSAKENLGELRRTLQRGIEVIRMTGNHHGIPVELVAKLARTFMTRANKARTFPPIEIPTPISTDILSVEQTESLETQTGRYWKVFLEMINSGNRYTPPLSGRLFDYRTCDIDLDELIQEAKLYSGYQAWRAGRREEAQKFFQTLTDPYASYYQGLLFKEMAEEELRKGPTEYQSRSAANILLNKSRDALYITLDRLRAPRTERFHPLDQKLAEAIEKVETKLGSLANVSVSNGHSTEEDESEKEFVTPTQVTSTPHRRSMFTNSMRNGTAFSSRLETSTRAEARPSPERLDAQLRQMVQRQDDFSKAISEELQQIRAEVMDIKSLIQKLESHLELQTKQEVRAGTRKAEDKASEIYEEECGDYGEEIEWEARQEEETDLDTLTKLKGMLKATSDQSSKLPIPFYAPPFGSSSARPAYGFQQPYGPPFQPHGYQQYPSFPYGGIPNVHGPPSGYPITPTYPYQGTVPFWGMEAGATASPMPTSFLPGMTPTMQTPIQNTVQPAASSSIQLPPPAQTVPTIPNVPHSTASPSVFSRLGTKDASTSLLATTLQQPVSTTPASVSEPDSATEALRKIAAGAITTGSDAPPHAYQISLPTQSTPEKVVDTSLVPAIKLSTQNLLASIPEPKYSSVTTSPDKTPKANRDRKVSSCSDASNAPEEEIDNYPDFKPIIPLPEEVEVRTGEEGEEVLFNERCKLFRFVDGEWKERGIGQLKFLEDPTTHKVRLVMRREQVLKICANHSITADLKLSEMKNAKNAWIWAAMDFAEDQPKLEKFAVRFKTPEQALDFQRVFDKAREADLLRSKDGTLIKAKEDLPPGVPKEIQGFGQQFAPPSGSWSCGVCYVNNKADAKKCVACETPKPGCEVEAKTPATIQIKFGMPNTSSPTSLPPGVHSGLATSASTPAIGSIFGTKTSTAVASTANGFKFGVTTSIAPVPAETKTSSGSFGSQTTPAPGFSIGAPISSTAVSSSTVTTTSPFSGFKFGSVPSSAPASSSTPSSAASTSSIFSGIKFGSPSSTVAGLPPSTSCTTVTFGNLSVTPVSAVTSSTENTSTVSTTSISSSTLPVSQTDFGSAKSSFSFSVPPSSSTAVTSTKAPFSFSPPKLTTPTATTQSNGQLDTTPFKTNMSSTAQAPLFEKSVFGIPQTTTPSLFGNFTFSSPASTSTTTATSTKSDEKKPEVKPSPFAGFSFSGFGNAPLKDTSEQKSESGMLFSMLAQQTPSTGFNKSSDKEFPGTGTPLFVKTTVVPKAEEGKDENEENEHDGEEYEPSATFEPVIPLPALIDVTTGEEDEKVLFCDRGFLYRYVPESKEWKEKGRGDMKILEHKTTGRVRLLMRREQVLKVCCNHYISSQLTLKPLQTSDRTWTWSAQDFSESELVNETFALKFKTAEQAQKFKSVFEEAQKKCEQMRDEAENHKEIKSAQVAPKSLSDLLAFKPKEGSWECQGCLLRNNSDVTKCPSCETLKPGIQATASTTAPPTSTVPSFKFGTEGGFKFGSTAPSPASFGAIATDKSSGSAYNFSVSNLSFSNQNQSQLRPKSPNVSASSDNEYYEEETGDNIHFEPVIPLPEKVQVKTGEEDEAVVYSHRAKLFRLSEGEWKERGIGDIKILKHLATGKTRLLMRREQILKICLNHALTPELNFRPKDDKSWIWVAQDYSEGEPKVETFVVRFKDSQIAKEFMKSIDENKISSPCTPENQAQGDIEVIFIKEASEEQKKKAKELMLPLNFFLYENAPPCPGCRGCEKEDSSRVSLNNKGTGLAVSHTIETESKVDSSSIGQFNFTNMAESKVASLSFSAIASGSASGFNKPASFSWSGTGQPIFGGATQKEAKQQPEEEENDDVPESNDPHFEPIIPLPALVEVKTGEEEEDVIFAQRAKLYRFESSTKEWKERGVGDMKILHDKAKNTYRVLLRRDQIHKLACNHWLTATMELRPMSTSTTAWTWSAMDFSQGELLSENFAVRFKTEDQAVLFKTKFQECQAALKDSKPISSSVQSSSLSSIFETVLIQPEVSATESSELHSETTKDKNCEDVEEEDEDDDEEDEYEDVEESIMFEKRCTLSCLDVEKWLLLGTGTLKIVYDDDMLCARIVVEDSSETLLCDNVIAIETNLEVDGKECKWSAIDYSTEEAIRRTFLAQFSSNEAALEFQSIFVEAKDFAEKSDVHDEPDPHIAGYDHGNEDDYAFEEGIGMVSEEAVSTTALAADCIRACDPQLAKALSEILSELK